MASCGDGGSCYIKNDAIVPFDGRVDINALELATEKGASEATLALLREACGMRE